MCRRRRRRHHRRRRRCRRRRRPYLLSSHIRRLVHRSTTFYSTYITFFTVHYYVFTVQVCNIKDLSVVGVGVGVGMYHK